MNKIIFLVGVGGTGGLLAGKLAKFLAQEDKIYLIDGDKVEYKNVVRQPFQIHDIDAFKAESLARKINSISQFKNCYSVNKFLNKEDSLFKIVKSVQEQTNSLVIISCVDNHKTRLLIEKSIQLLKEFLKKMDYSYVGYPKPSDLFYIDSANEDDYGDILINEFRSKIYKLKIEKTDELLLTEDSCENLINDGVIQQFATNDQASNLILRFLFDIEYFKNKKCHIKFDKYNSKIDILKGINK
ncbi:ThiF family adenylyltransferase [Spiroplasma taiwanense]|uniref:THIF-type NAD/FAD binding fold domain-containing protein n=1 Tax=Spiroplasma taiwanense CT-1 TaxID=1276220 RepID=S5LZF3_9MOLU|nr:ThiF family adenylyltransferase [Spiroplasma taiwanense]AGR41087.1 hypothetical protein STAIW_v1c04410 [Spiroplasma taiwanense CT-1]